MKILGIMGSPRILGNTDILLNQALKGAMEQGAEIEKLIVDKLKIEPCREYYGCRKNGNCIIEDDMESIYASLIQSDRVIVASPIFFYGLTSQLKALIDRCQALWCRKYILKQEIPGPIRYGSFIGVGATRGDKLFTGSILTIKYFFEVIGAKYFSELLIRGVDNKGEIKKQKDALDRAFILGRELVNAQINEG